MNRLFLLVFLVPLVASIPINQDKDTPQKSEAFDVFLPHVRGRGDRNSVLKIYRWANGVIPYHMSPNLEEHKSKIHEVMKYITDVTCIKFRKMIPGDPTYLLINGASDCNADVGTIPGRQILGMSLKVPECLDKSVLLHLLTKVIGLYDEHNRPDRDEYINIHWENIKDGYAEEFYSIPPDALETFNAFDYDSIMMFPEYAASKDPKAGLKTITAKKPGVTIRGFLGKTLYNRSDIYRIKQMYCPS